MIRFSMRRAAVAAAALAFSSVPAFADTVSPNTGSLGAAANGANTDSVTFVTGVVGTGSDLTPVYNNSDATRTTVPYQPALNPAAGSPFSIEFWARPTATDNDDAPVANRVSSGNRSGWAFFQRDEATGWNFRMYNGNGSATMWDVTGGAAPLNAWSHVVATWNGSAATLYVNGAAVGTNIATGGGTYNPNTTVPLTVGTLADATGSSPFNGAVDEVALYGSALTPAQVLNHFNLVSSPAYYSTVRADGALLQLSNVPEPTSMTLLGAAGALLLGRRRRA